MHDCDFWSMHMYILTMHISILIMNLKRANIWAIQGNTFCCFRLGGGGSCLNNPNKQF